MARKDADAPTPPMRVLALDFDGVISDSAPEAFVVALTSFAALRPGSALAAQAACLGAEKAPDLASVLGCDLYPGFLERMPLGNRAEDYAVVLASLAEDLPLPDQQAYDALRAAEDAGWLARYHHHFYAVRDALAARDPEGWRALMAPYPEVVSLLRRRAGDVTLAIATAKDRRSVLSLLALYGIDDLFDAACVLDKETGVGKAAHLTRLRERLAVDFGEITFVDDKVNHLERVADLGVRCGLAAWGYNGEREVRRARARGYLVCELSRVEAQLFGASPRSR